MTHGGAGAARVNPIVRRLGAYGGPARILGVDVARGLAVLGMIVAHVGVTVPFEWADPSTWLDLVNGHSSVLFATLAGVSIAIISGGSVAAEGEDLRDARLRILVRAALIFLIGALLQALDTRIAVILTVYGVLFVAAIPFLRWRPRSLFLLAGGIAILAPLGVTLLKAAGLRGTQGPDSPSSGLAGGDTIAGALADLFVTGPYPAVLWLAFVLSGLGVGRLDLRQAATRLRLLAAGILLTAIGYAGGALAQAAVGEASAVGGVSAVGEASAVGGVSAVGEASAVGGASAASSGGSVLGGLDTWSLVSTEAHSGSGFDLVGSTGFALVVLALCLLVSGLFLSGPLASTPLRWVLYPIAAVGAMALTAYTGQIVVIAAAFPVTAFTQPDNTFCLLFLLVTLVACSLWTLLLGRGPLERLLGWASRRVAARRIDRGTRGEQHR